MTCDDFGADLIARMLGELPDTASVALDTHLSACATCRDAAAEFAPVLEGSRALGSPEPSEAALDALRSAVLRDEGV